MSPLHVAPYEGTAEGWDDFVRAQPGWTHFHLYGWRAVMEGALRHRAAYLAARDDTGALVGVLPLVHVRSWLFGGYLVSMPFVNYGGPLGTPAAVQALATEAARRAADAKVKLLELRSRVPLDVELAVSHRRITVLLDLPADASALWARLPAKLRSQVRRPRKDGVVVRMGLDQVDAFHAVFAHHMRDLGTPPQSRAFFHAIAAAFPGDVRIAVAWLGDEPIAAGWGFLWDHEFEISWASALRAHKASSANMLVYWALMEAVIAEGARVFNFGRCAPGGGTHRFKQQWGGRDEPLWWYQRAASGALDATPSPDRGAYALAARVWQRLPTPLTTALGPAIVRGIP